MSDSIVGDSSALRLSKISRSCGDSSLMSSSDMVSIAACAGDFTCMRLSTRADQFRSLSASPSHMRFFVSVDENSSFAPTRVLRTDVPRRRAAAKRISCSSSLAESLSVLSS